MSRKFAFSYPLAAVLALLAALFVALDFTPPGRLARDAYAIARVNNIAIPLAEYVRALDAMQAGLERPLNHQDRSRALTILINEELIVQEALRLNLASDDRLVRKNLIQAIIASVIVDTQQEVPEQTLREFYENEMALFAKSDSVTVNVLRTTPNSDVEAFTTALQDGGSFAAAGTAAAMERIDVATGIPTGKLGATLGGKARDTVLGMMPGDIAGPVESMGGDIFIWLLEKDGGAPAYTQVRDSVAAEWRRRQEELAMERYLTRLRKQARIKHYSNADVVSN